VIVVVVVVEIEKSGDYLIDSFKCLTSSTICSLSCLSYLASCVIGDRYE
jgi:hypothetical protein